MYTDYYSQNEQDSARLSLQVAAGIFALSLSALVYGLFIKDMLISDIEEAKKECDLSSPEFLVSEDLEAVSAVGLKGDSISQMSKLNCLFDKVKFPDSARIRLANTTALMGSQSDEWDDYKAEWAYHPDNGLGFYLSEK